MELRWSKNKAGESKAMRSWQFNAKGPVFQFLAAFNLILCCLFLINSTAIPQTIKGSYSFNRRPDQVEELLKKLSEDKLEEVPKCFFGENVVYDAELADLLVFIDKRERCTNIDLESSASEFACLKKDNFTRFAVIKDGKKREELFGERFIYVMVFVAENYCEQNTVGKFTIDNETTEKVVEKSIGNTSGKTEEKVIEMLLGDASGKTGEIIIEKTVGDTCGKTDEVPKTIKYREPLSVFQSSLDSRPGSGEFILYSVIRSIANIFSGEAIEKAEKSERAADIKNIPLRMYLVGSDNKSNTNLYFGILIKTPIYENTINRFTVQEEYVNNEDPHQNIKKMHLATFGNYSSSYVTSSIGLMGTFLKSELIKSETGVIKSSRTPLDAFIFAHIYLKRPQIPPPRYQENANKNCLKKISFSIAVGTKISTSLFDDLFFGVSVGHFYSTVGVVAGVNYRTTTLVGDDDKIRKKRKLYFSLGLTLML